MIAFQNVTKTYPGTPPEVAVDNVSATFAAGQIHGIIGSSGAGKSTLIRLINQLERHDAGTVSVFEYTDLRVLNRESTRMLRKRIGMMFQTDHLLSRKTVLDNVLLPLRFFRSIGAEDIAKANALLQEVGLADYAHRYPAQLSGGQRQRVGIARALINDPELLLCDEPTSALDVMTRGQILSLIRSVAVRHGVDVVIVSHDMHVIKEICDTVTVMDKGVIVESGPLLDILYKPKHAKTKAFVREVGLDVSLLCDRYEAAELLLLHFDESIVDQGIVTAMSNDLNVTPSILFANVMPGRNGMMLLSVPDKQDAVIRYLTDRKVGVDRVV